MAALGSGNNGEFTFLDLVSLASFFIGIENLEMNLTQDDKQDLQQDLAEKSDLLLNEIHGHLEKQDALLTQIIKVLEGLKNDS